MSAHHWKEHRSTFQITNKWLWFSLCAKEHWYCLCLLGIPQCASLERYEMLLYLFCCKKTKTSPGAGLTPRELDVLRLRIGSVHGDAFAWCGWGREGWEKRGERERHSFGTFLLFSSNSSAKESPNLELLLFNVEAWQDQFCCVNTHLQDFKGFSL